MTITLELSPKTEANLSALATARGLPVSVYVQHLLEDQITSQVTPPLSSAERGVLWRESAKKFPHTPRLSDAAMSRENFYGERG